MAIYDIFLVDAETGFIVYSVFKEVDYATSLKSGPYRDTGIGKVFRKALEATSPDAVVIEDFAPYEPSYNASASFIASSLFLIVTLLWSFKPPPVTRTIETS